MKEVAQTLASAHGQGVHAYSRPPVGVLRNDACRLKVSKSGFKYPSRDSSVVEDWVEVFAPVVFEPHARRSVFRIFAALGYDERLERSVTRIEGFPDKSPASWKKFLTSLSGRPQWIVCDNESGMLKGIELRLGRIRRTSPRR